MVKHLSAAVLLAVVLLSFLLSGWQPAAANTAISPPIKIMPFGDSITSSVGTNTYILGKLVPAQASYRYELYNDLHNDGIAFVFTGTRVDNYGGPPLHAGMFDQHNESWSGAMAADFLNPVQPFFIDKLLNANSYGTTVANVPGMVLMHLGTNDLYYNHSVSTTIADLGSLIDKFRAKNPKVIILLAQIIPCAPTNFYLPKNPDRTSCAKIPGLNAAIPALAQQKHTAISPVVVVDQYTGFDAAQGHDTYDGLHPNASGEVKMANKWLAAIIKWYNYIPYRILLPLVVK